MYVVTSDQIPSNIKGVFFVVDPPGLFWIFYRVMKVFASAETLSKFKFVTSKGKACTAGATGRMHPEFAANFEADQLEEDYGGTLTSNWDAEAYFAEEERQAKNAQCVEREEREECRCRSTAKRRGSV